MTGVRILENGLLDLSKTPERLVAIAKRNATSPLLRLPIEVRSRIWHYAIGGGKIGVSSGGFRGFRGTGRPRADVVTMYKPWAGEELWGPFAFMGNSQSYKGFNLHDREHPFSTSIGDNPLSLSRVSRQVYSETSIMAYLLNVVCFNSFYTLAQSTWLSRLPLASRQAIQQIELDFFECFKLGIEKEFPGLKTLILVVEPPLYRLGDFHRNKVRPVLGDLKRMMKRFEVRIERRDVHWDTSYYSLIELRRYCAQGMEEEA